MYKKFCKKNCSLSIISKTIVLLSIIAVNQKVVSQQWIDTLYQIQTEYDIPYGTAVNFAGKNLTLHMDISYPLNDTAPVCGRPLLVLVHGGAWMAGNKDDPNIRSMREDFAKRGYTTAAVNYRLGMFHTNQFVNCNVPDWNCFNMTDTIEWYRANHRAMQDVNGAIRYLVNNSHLFNINPDNIFIAGESAGGFISMSVAFIDDMAEVQAQFTGNLPDVPAPNALYEGPCIQNYNLAPSIDSMNLSRPDLGSYTGALNFPANKTYEIKAVGNFYGGIFSNFLSSSQSHIPALYLHHQQCDLIVHHNYSRLLSGYVECMLGFPAYCGYIVHRPFAYGSTAIKNLIDDMTASSVPAPEYFYDFSNNNYNCAQQTDPALTCHAIAGYWLRTSNMAGFFASKIDTCNTQFVFYNVAPNIQIYPNPAYKHINIQLPDRNQYVKVILTSAEGKIVSNNDYFNISEVYLPVDNYSDGLYFVTIISNNYSVSKKVLIIGNK